MNEIIIFVSTAKALSVLTRWKGKAHAREKFSPFFLTTRLFMEFLFEKKIYNLTRMKGNPSCEELWIFFLLFLFYSRTECEESELASWAAAKGLKRDSFYFIKKNSPSSLSVCWGWMMKDLRYLTFFKSYLQFSCVCVPLGWRWHLGIVMTLDGLDNAITLFHQVEQSNNDFNLHSTFIFSL